MIVKRGDKFVVTTEDGRALGTHDSRAAAVKQLQAVEISKHKRMSKHMNERMRGKD